MLEYDGSAWHEDCFMCHGCEKPIGAEAFVPDKNNYYCVPCYEGRFAPQCSHCKKVGQAGVEHSRGRFVRYDQNFSLKCSKK